MSRWIAASRAARIAVRAVDDSGTVDNTANGPLNAWLEAVDAIQPSRVQVYTIARPPALGVLKRTPVRRLREIAERVRALGIPADAFG